MDFPGGSVIKNLPANAGDRDSIPDLGRSPGKETATHSSILVSEISWTEKPGKLWSMGSQRVRHELATERQQSKNINILKNHHCRNFLGGPVVKTPPLPIQEAWV